MIRKLMAHHNDDRFGDSNLLIELLNKKTKSITGDEQIISENLLTSPAFEKTEVLISLECSSL